MLAAAKKTWAISALVVIAVAVAALLLLTFIDFP
jgi:hypothetical protein